MDFRFHLIHLIMINKFDLHLETKDKKAHGYNLALPYNDICFMCFYITLIFI